MTVSDIAKRLDLTVESGSEGLNREVTGAYVSDLLSDVMGNATEGQAWITLQVHKNTIAIASLKDLAAIILVKGLKPAPDCARQSDEEKIPILTSQKNTFELSGKLYKILMG
jgi:predicted transcriptional regulator